MAKKLVINTSKRKAADIAALERKLDGNRPDKDYRFTAVLPESVGQKLRVHCAHNKLKIKNVFAEAVTDFLDRKINDPLTKS